MIELIVAMLLAMAPAQPAKPYLTTAQANALRHAPEAPIAVTPIKISVAE